jgi:hypothetical protein
MEEWLTGRIRTGSSELAGLHGLARPWPGPGPFGQP